jgi:sugar phosphate isomerase/epimerase
MDRRWFFWSAGSGLAAAALGSVARSPLAAADEPAPKTRFQLACMTLPYAQFPLRRALQGIKAAGYEYVAWGTTHVEEGGQRVPVMPTDAPPENARQLGQLCRDLGLAPLMMFATVYPEAPHGLELHTSRIKQASAAGIPQVLTFGHTMGGNRELWVARFKQLGPIARDHNVTIVIKQHGGTTGTGEACAEIVREIDHPNVMVNYDAGNVMDYLNVDPIPDIQKCAPLVRSFCMKDHRNWPKDEDCGPGFGEIDHYRLLHPVAHTGLTMPLCCENIFAPLVPRPKEPDGVDKLARQVREYLEAVIAGLQA